MRAGNLTARCFGHYSTLDEVFCVARIVAVIDPVSPELITLYGMVNRVISSPDSASLHDAWISACAGSKADAGRG
jgi:hypothetical protein